MSDVLAVYNAKTTVPERKHDAKCSFCGGRIISDPELGKSCEDCQRLPLTYACS